MRNKARNIWTREEIKILYKCYPSGIIECMKHLSSRSRMAIQLKAQKLGIRAPKQCWSNSEIAILKRYYSNEGTKCIRYFHNRSRMAIQLKAKSLNIIPSRFWTDLEINILKKYYPSEGIFCASRLPGRTIKSIPTIARNMGIRRDFSVKKQIPTKRQREESSRRLKTYWSDPIKRQKRIEMTTAQWANPESHKKLMQGIGIRKATNEKPNSKELFLEERLTEWLPGEFKYVGNWEVAIGGKCPDFININGRKLLIEHFGSYWHGEERTGKSRKQTEQERIEHFSKHGYKTLIIWENELKDMTKLKNSVFQFVGIS